jgi:hypothetical protein
LFRNDSDMAVLFYVLSLIVISSILINMDTKRLRLVVLILMLFNLLGAISIMHLLYFTKC